MFIGTYADHVQPDMQLSLPPLFQGHLTAGVVVTRGFEQNLLLFPLLRWLELAQAIAAQPLSDSHMRQFRRHFFSFAVNLQPDAQGRITIPSTLLNFADIDGPVITAGMFDHVELWSAASWETQVERRDTPEWPPFEF